MMEVTQSYTACEFAAQQLGVAIVEPLEDSQLALVYPKDRPLEGAALCLRAALMEGLPSTIQAPPT
jgi:hypothetical protein